MRRASTCLALLGLAILGSPVAASAAPTVTFKATAVPIPGFPHTGNILGAGAAVKFEWTIKGTEYGGFQPPLIGVNTFFPAGTVINPAGFTSCSPTSLQKHRRQVLPEGVQDHNRRRSRSASSRSAPNVCPRKSRSKGSSRRATSSSS